MAEAAVNDELEINPILAQLRFHSEELIKATALDMHERRGTIANERMLLRLHKQLNHQKCELQTRIGADEVSIEEGSLEFLNEENLQETAKHTEEEIEKLQVGHYNKTRALHNIQIFSIIQNTLLEKSVESESISKILKHSTANCSRILEEEQKTRELEKQLMEVRKKRQEMKQSCTKLLTELQALVEEGRSLNKPKEKTLEKISHIIKEEMDSTTTIQNVFQRLVFASHVNWTEKPALREAVLKAGKDVNRF